MNAARPAPTRGRLARCRWGSEDAALGHGVQGRQGAWAVGLGRDERAGRWRGGSLFCLGNPVAESGVADAVTPSDSDDGVVVEDSANEGSPEVGAARRRHERGLPMRLRSRQTLFAVRLPLHRRQFPKISPPTSSTALPMSLVAFVAFPTMVPFCGLPVASVSDDAAGLD